MSRSILVIDTPGNCVSCRMGNINMNDMGKGGMYCQFNKREKISWENAKKEKPVWCPLKEIQKTSVGIEACIGNQAQCLQSYVDGYNACLDEILKESEEV